MNPIQLFKEWYSKELEHTKVKIPSACCLSTIGLDNYPNSRFVSLKGILENSFIITGPINSRKGLEIENSEKVMLTFWWTETERQVRIQGDAVIIADELADQYFAERSRDSQIVSIVSEQGNGIANLELLHNKYQVAEFEFKNKSVSRPSSWGGFSIKPKRIEFMDFKSSRFHDRKLYERINDIWTLKQLQP